MITDKELYLSEDQAITATAFSQNSFDVLRGNTNTALRDIAPGEPVRVIAIVKEDFDALTSLDIKLWGNDTDTFPGGIEIMTQNILLADLTAGKKVFDRVIPVGLAKRWYKAEYVVNGTNPTTGIVDLFWSKGTHEADQNPS